jgi:hypothetical protein
MGYAANGFCFDTPDAAAAYACGHDYPLASVMVDASGHPAAVVVECTGVAVNVLTLQRDVNGAVDGTSTLALTAPACDVTEWQTFYPFSMSATTGATVGAAVVGCWLVGWGWKAVYGVLKGRISSSVGDDE